MNQSFVNIYPQLISDKVDTLSMTGLWLLHGDEPLMSQWIIDALRVSWQKQGKNIQRIELVSTKTWYDVMTELDSLSLFAAANAIIVTGSHKPDKQIQQALLTFANQASNSETNHLIWITNKQDKRNLSSKAFAAFNTKGMIVDCRVINEKQRQQILYLHASKFGFQLTPEAWELLISHTQNHLLNAYQALWRLSDLCMPTMIESNHHKNDSTPLLIEASDLHAAIISAASYNIYELSDAMLLGNHQQVISIISGFQSTKESPSSILWVIAKDMRLIQQLLTGKDPNSLGIWKSKQRLYQTAILRTHIQDTKRWSEMIFNCDKAIKGVIKQPIWELLLQSALAVSGIQLFSK